MKMKARLSITVLAAALAFAGCDKGTTTTPVEKVIPEGMVFVEGGVFQMGTPEPDGYSDERPVHSVTISGFYMGKYEVTQAEYEEVMGSNPSYYKGETRLPAEGEVQGNRPVETVSWYDAVEYCNALSEAEGLEKVYTISGADVTADFSKNGYRLPTEAEWEYAAKGGNGSPGNYEYSGSDNVAEVAWYDGNSNGITHEVGKKKANGLGIYDMSGNVWELCWDWYVEYTAEAQNNPTGVSAGSYRVLRGGSWVDPAGLERSALRHGADPSSGSDVFGFRVARPQF